ncbi:MAG: N-acetyltransferase family protein [Pseudobdellovibrionaceae bacterium]
MGALEPKSFQTRSGKFTIVRSAVSQDASALLELAKSVIGEEIYQLTSSAEFTMTIENEKKWIESHVLNPNHIVLVAEVDGEIVGMLDFSNGHRSRIAHTGEFGMSVDQTFRDQGIGSALLNALIEWATQSKVIEKIGLCVHSSNERAIALYKKMGFEVEGIRRRELKYGKDQYVDTVVMGRFVK